MASVTPYGDTAVLVEVDDIAAAHALAAAVAGAVAEGRAPVGITDVVIGFASVVLHLGADPGGHALTVPWVHGLLSAATAASGTGAGAEPTPGPGRRARPAQPVSIPVAFDGPDLDAVGETIGATAGEVIDLLCGSDLEVAFLGFSPGFPYLVGLPAALAAIERRPTPRPSVPSGSVAVAGGFAAVYPQSTPGGWMLLGRTPLALFDPHRPPYARLRPGDAVRFHPARAGRHPIEGARRPVGRAPLRARGPRWVEVLRPGLLSLIQDAGRVGVASLGVPTAGPADPESMALANRLVGNADGAAALEVTVTGPTLRFGVDAYVAVVASGPGAVEPRLDGLACGDGVVVPVASGQVLDVGNVRTGVRAYLAVGGGFETPVAVGSRSSDVLCGLGPGPLVEGDRLPVGRPARPRGALAPAVGDPAPPGVLRVLRGPHRLDDGAWHHLLHQAWTVEERSNRIGLRLTGGRPVAVDGERAVPSTGMVTGAVQLPADGAPIILLPDHATVGGYPVVGCVISADRPVLGQLGPGQAVVLTEVDLDGAVALEAARRRSSEARVSGWFPTGAGT